MQAMLFIFLMRRSISRPFSQRVSQQYRIAANHQSWKPNYQKKPVLMMGQALRKDRFR